MQLFGKRSDATPITILVLSGAGGLANVVLGTVANLAELPLYLDSIFTIVVTFHLGLLPGIVTAVVTNATLAATGQVLLPFVCCNILTALITWAFMKRAALNDAGGFVWLGIVVGLANAFLGSAVAYGVYSGVTDVHAIDRLVMGLVVTGQSVLTSVFWSGMVTNLIDKMISAMAVFVSQQWISSRLSRGIIASRSSGQS